MSVKTRVNLSVAILAALSLALPAAALTPGAVEWETSTQFAGGSNLPDLVEASAGRVVMVGEQVTDSGAQDIRLTALSAADGAVLWDTTFDRNGGYEYALDVIVTPKDVLVVGGAQDGPDGQVDGLVLRYDVKTGQLIWASWYDRLGFEEAFIGVALSGWRIVAAGQSLKGTTGPADAIAVSYDFRDGSQLWYEVYDPAGGWDLATDVVVARNLAVISGTAQDTDNRDYLFVKGHDLQSGDPVWITTYDGGHSARGGALATVGNTVYVAGDESAAAGKSADVMVRAYDAADGALLWADAYDVDGFYDSAYDIDVGGGVVVVTGEGRSSAFSPDLLTRAYDAVTGTALWTVQHDVAGSSDQSWAVEITDSLAVIVGQGYDGDYEWVVRAYDLATGALAWDDVFDRSGGSDSARDVTSLGPSVFVVGSTQEAGTGYPGEHSDGTIRTYRR